MKTGNEHGVDELNAILEENRELLTTVKDLTDRVLHLERDLDNTRAEFDEYRSEDRRS